MRQRGRWHTMTPRERWRSAIPVGELAVIDHAGDLTAQLELGLSMLGIACDLLAAITGRTGDDVYTAIEKAAA